MAPSITSAIMAAPAGAVRRVSRRSAADVSHAPIKMRNQTGKCHVANALAQPLSSENFAIPWLAKTYARKSVGTHSARSPHGIFFTLAPPRVRHEEPLRGRNFPSVQAL